jgi:hypothetical protein
MKRSSTLAATFSLTLPLVPTLGVGMHCRDALRRRYKAPVAACFPQRRGAAQAVRSHAERGNEGKDIAGVLQDMKK